MARSFHDENSRDKGRTAFTVSFPDYIEDVVLAADTLVRVPIPANARYAVFSFSGDFRAKLGVVATGLTLPSSTSTDGTGSELNPAARFIPSGSNTHIILRAPLAQTGSIAFYEA